MSPRPFVRNAPANFSAEDIEIELEIGALFVESRQIDGDGLKIDAAGEIDPADRETIFLPFDCAAKLRKCLSKQGRGDRSFARGARPGFTSSSRRRCGREE